MCENDRHSIIRRHRVETDTLETGPIAVLNAPGVPQPWQSYVFHGEAHLLCYCRRRHPERIAPASKIWVVESEYETPDTSKGENPAAADNPLLEIPEDQMGL